jgi:hypothetical protein
MGSRPAWHVTSCASNVAVVLYMDFELKTGDLNGRARGFPVLDQVYCLVLGTPLPPWSAKSRQHTTYILTMC